MIKEILNKIPERVRLLLFWPLFGAAFWYLEIMGTGKYHIVHSFLDDKIPFCEYFIVPYYFWFVFLIGMIVYGFFWDIDALRNYMRFTAITYTVTLIIYAVYPTAQELRVQTFLHDNIFVDTVKFAYTVDTNTNVCPSIHVLGSLAVYFAAGKSRLFGTRAWRAAFLITTVLITLSTLFVKQHSVIDIAVALVLGLSVYPIVYPRGIKSRKSVAEQRTEAGVI